MTKTMEATKTKTKTFNIDNYTQWVLEQALKTGYLMRGEITDLIERESGFEIVFYRDLWHDNKLKKEGTYIEPTFEDKFMLSAKSKIILMRAYILKKFRYSDLEKLSKEIEFTIRVYNPEFEKRMREIREENEKYQAEWKLKYKMVQLEGAPKGSKIAVRIDYPHETYTIPTFKR